MVTFSLFVVAILAFSAVRDVYLLSPRRAGSSAATMGVVFVMHAGILSLLRFTTHVTLAGVLCSGLACAASLHWFVQNGGLDGGSLPWLAIVPVVSIAYSGRWAGAFWALITMAGVVASEALLKHSGDLTGSSHTHHQLLLTNTLLVLAFLTTLSFIYDLKLEQTLDDALRAQEDAERSASFKGRFLANMSHEIRTPMTAILGYADELLEDGDLTRIPPDRLHAVNSIRHNGRHLLEIINDILDLSKIEAGRLSLENVLFSPVRLLAEVRSMMRVPAESRGLQLAFEFPTPIPIQAEGDPTRIRQILINLVSNAIKFTPQGSIRVVTRTVADTGVPRLQFEVIDPGVGMSENQMSRLFQPFTQADESTTREYGGTGLGLSICRRLADLMGGNIELRSEVGRGTTFRVTLPVEFRGESEPVNCPSWAALQHPDPDPSPSPGLSCYVLLAEDAPDNQRLIRRILERAGARVEVAADGQSAVERALAARADGAAFDVILMDMQMPRLDGYDATRMLRSSDYDLPIVALTAHAMSGDRERCLQAGCDDFATKPIDRARLIATVARYAGGKVN